MHDILCRSKIFLVNDQRDAQNLLYVFISIYNSLHVSSTAEQSTLNRCTVQPFTESDDNRCCVNTIFPPEDGHVNARNMSRIIV